MAPRSGLAAGLGVITGVAALAAGGIALGIELERRIVAKRITRTSEADLEAFFSLRSDGPDVTTPDGVVLHTEIDEGADDDLTLVLCPWLCAEPGLLALPAAALPRPAASSVLRPAFPWQVNPLRGRALQDPPARRRPVPGPAGGRRPWTGGSDRALDGRDDDHATCPVTSRALRQPGIGRRALLHVGWGADRPLTNTRHPGPHLSPSRRAVDGGPEPDTRAGLSGTPRGQRSWICGNSPDGLRIRRAAKVDDVVGVLLGDLRAADARALQPSRFEQSPGALARRVLEYAAA